MSDGPAAPELERFELVVLRRPEHAPELPDHELDRLQAEHLAHLDRLHREGLLLVAGPFADQADASLRGMCLLRVGSVGRARELLAEDPAVRAGRLEADVCTFLCPVGMLAAAGATPDGAVGDEGT